MLSLTLNWIFKWIALWFTYKTGLGLGASGQSFQLLYSHPLTFNFFIPGVVVGLA